jgi:hypothetical protein
MNMSFVADPVSQCSGKERFGSPQAAWKAARRHNASRHVERKVEAYKCPHCRAHHIGGSNG